ncbi:1-acyl-sn-glycerol-3-phosphate acyltransferase [Pseudactinotalea sp. HY158]|uniref:lysophospholipid acyltransferase family protein n=1 Tax=Pseudactinotalea sp. HY158 TaxID=2654547 RepID=UPI001E592EC2|nr:1-acyl-sn-glycerol-3-phosphate acyltransferase [Pseudactinotalea sp. HY158]
MTHDPATRPRPPRAYLVLKWVLGPVVRVMTRREWSGGERLPHGGFIAVANHLSDADPFTFGLFLVDHGIYPRILAKDSLFRVPVVGRVLRSAGIIPVERGRASAAASLEEARAALAAGECVAIYPEGTHTFDPDLWPMTAKTGAARLALTTRAPVVPVAQWGPQEFRPPHSRRINVRALPFPARVRAGGPVDLSDLYDDAPSPSAGAVAAATGRIMAALTAELAILRGMEPPAQPYDRSRGPAGP